MAQAQSPTTLGAEKLSPSLVNQFGQMDEEDTITVLIEFDAPLLSRSKMAIGQSKTKKREILAERRKAIKEARHALFDSKEFRSGVKNRPSRATFNTIDNIPFLIFSGTRSEIESISKNESVKNIAANELLRPQLGASTLNIGMAPMRVDGLDGAGQTVVIIDSGVEKSHSFFGNRVVAEACFSTPQAFGSATSQSLCPQGNNTGPGSGVNCGASINGCDHGTHVAGIAAGNGGTSQGVASGADIVSIQVYGKITDTQTCIGLNSAWTSGDCSAPALIDVVSALNHVFTLTGSMNIAAVNLSLGGSNFTSQCGGLFSTPISQLSSAGVAIIAASGNDNQSNAIAEPACVSTAISVGATVDATDEVFIGSANFGSNSASFLDLLAPGAGINSSVPGGGFTSKTGTSQAAPHVTGAFAVLRAANPGVSVSQILSALKNTGEPITDPRNNIIKPRIDVAAAHAYLNTTSPNNGTASIVVVPLNGFTLIQTSGQ